MVASYTTNTTSIPDWMMKLIKENERGRWQNTYQDAMQKHTATQSYSQEYVDKLISDLNFAKKHAENLREEVVRRGNLMVERCDRIEELEQALKYLHDNIADYYPSTYDFPSMVNARETLKKDREDDA